ncbi:1-(5-phosphoribosyl)-5-amino-4-imidazole-carboxylate carboxylase [Candidatus Epulonipiscium fishelsonii]|uniref:1-(5-phosphoribosyl)-5-amino-4-imidazole-carboxylate carboxylase n=1 Tax=Candidatus Epulonipiscium fishelsonii TaxID=77094 RepID=A0ACC8XDM4_9FIRM|nr:1-(5-phosphoribosyl)-5-amino-4-imidazole-carboxylate carboxylase [Epulopiscium sp. SCG-B05WGA-EpuloA1]ONI41031.1 1-(5-phosphoribosyl)-5-amino-4-imidazole-carboxylate carboxylase [Epulopiscium sp. SCG-B11WGA-EpuloA1]ONI47393.1 1-(5-phosphoribosyl)-5-amino-4-imidazole-carboxylate carboxylase [Epulopiscium sp. SCG-C06WGA-EpuloA1]
MDNKKLTDLLNQVKNGNVEVEYALSQLKQLEYGELGYAKIDHHRQLRNGYPEVIYCEGKALDHIQGIVKHMLERNNNNILCTRASQEVFNAIFEVTDKALYHERAKIVVVKREEYKVTEKKILVVTGGTSDIPVAEEAAITAEVLGNTVGRLYDVGVAGIHRLLSNTKVLQEANVIITVAGMEGALASVVGGLVDKPVIAVPTSIGYGANFGGLSALLCMLNSCASGITVVNIDNGFGAAYSASMINNL